GISFLHNRAAIKFNFLWMRGIGFRQPLKRVGDPRDAVGGAQCIKTAPYEDRSATAPNAGLDYVAGDLIGNHRLDALPDIIQPHARQHRDRVAAHVMTRELHDERPDIRIVVVGLDFEERARERLREQIKIEVYSSWHSGSLLYDVTQSLPPSDRQLGYGDHGQILPSQIPLE